MDISKKNKLIIKISGDYNDTVIVNDRLYDANNPSMYDTYARYNPLDKDYISSFAIIFGYKHKSGIVVTNVKDINTISVTYGDYDQSSGKLINTTSLTDIDYHTYIRRTKLDYSIKELITMCAQSAVAFLNLLKFHPEYFISKIIHVQGKKKNSKPIKVNEYYLDTKHFAYDYIGEDYSKIDRIVVPDDYKMYDQNDYLKPVFPLQSGVVSFSPSNEIINEGEEEEDDGPYINHTASIVTFHVSEDKLFLKVWLANDDDGKLTLCVDCAYNLKSKKIDNFIPATKDSDPEDVFGSSQFYVDFTIDVLKYMAYHVEIMSKKDVPINSIENVNNPTPKLNDKPRFETSICSHKVYGITKKVIPVTEAEAKEKRKYTPCQYAVTVKGHFRHYKSGKVIWVEHYIRNKDKEFKPKDYVDKKKEG
jgi:hypothetical protein